MFHKSEIKYFVIAVLVMAFALAFNDGSEVFEWAFWLKNFLMVTLIVGFSFLIHQIAHKLAAQHHGFETEFKLWGIQSLKFSAKNLTRAANKTFPRTVNIFGKKILVHSFPIGVVLALIITIFSNGMLFFVAVGQYTLLVKKGLRVGKKYIEVTDYEEAKIALAGPMMHIFLMLIASFFNDLGLFDTFIFVNAMLALFYMIPIHNLDGAKILLGSPVLYLTSLVFMVSFVILAYFLSPIPLVIITGLASLTVGALFYYHVYFKG